MDDRDRAPIAIGKCSVMRRGDGNICTFWIRHCLDDMKKLHVQDIVDVDFNLQDPNGQYERNVKVPDDGGGEWLAGLHIHVPHDSMARRCYEIMYMGHGSGM